MDSCGGIMLRVRVVNGKGIAWASQAAPAAAAKP